MRYAAIRPFDIANGVGVRTTLFVAGCTHHCPGCFNEAYQDFNYGTAWSQEEEAVFMGHVNNPNSHGVTLLGGEPMDQTQDDDLIHLLQRIKGETDKSIWVYSGYTFEQIMADDKKKAMLMLVDVLVDGRFVEVLKDIKLQFRGSSNQRIIDVQASLRCGEVVLYPLNG